MVGLVRLAGSARSIRTSRDIRFRCPCQEFAMKSAQDRETLPNPLQLTRAGQLSVDSQRAGAARLFRIWMAAARPRQCYYRPSRSGPRS